MRVLRLKRTNPASVRTDPKGSGEGQGRAMGFSKPLLTPVIRKVPKPNSTQPRSLGAVRFWLPIKMTASHRTC
jgi:hypothetical protein